MQNAIIRTPSLHFRGIIQTAVHKRQISQVILQIQKIIAHSAACVLWPGFEDFATVVTKAEAGVDSPLYSYYYYSLSLPPFFPLSTKQGEGLKKFGA